MGRWRGEEEGRLAGVRALEGVGQGEGRVGEGRRRALG